jgi:hypothetical protein
MQEPGSGAPARLDEAGSPPATPAQALHCAVISEHCAQVAWGARALGGPAALPASTVQAFGRAYLQARRSAHG